MKCKPEITPFLKWFGQNDLHPLAKPSSMRLPTSTSKSLWRGRTNTPLTTFYKWFTLLQIFNEKEGGEHSSNLKVRLAKALLRLFSLYCFSKVVISAENWGVFIGLKRIQIWAPKFEFSWVSDAGSATARPLGCWAVPPPRPAVPPPGYFSSLVGLQTWPKPVRTQAQLAPTWVIGLTPNPNPN